jgi:hypothetical protein
MCSDLREPCGQTGYPVIVPTSQRVDEWSKTMKYLVALALALGVLALAGIDAQAAARAAQK